MLTIDSEFQALIPALATDERDALEASILAEGCRDAIVVWRHDGSDIIVDGHNRYAICTAHDVPYNVVTRDFSSRSDVMLWMIRNQLARRNLTPFKRTELALQMEAVIAEQARANSVQSGYQYGRGEKDPQNFADPIKPIETRQEVGRIAEVSHETVRKVKNVLEAAPAPIVDKARAGDISIHAAERITKALQGLPDDVVEVALRLADDSVDKVEILHGLHKSNGRDGSNQTFDEITRNGGFHYGDEMDDWCDFASSSVSDIRRALASVAKYHAGIEMQAKQAQKMDARIQQVNISHVWPAVQFIHADCVDALASLPASSVKLLLTDPPYGMGFQSNRRTATPQAPKITNDDTIDAALSICDNMLDSIDHAMMPECHVLMFCNWRYEYHFMELLCRHQYDIAASLIWVKENHTSGDLSGFAPKHERIIHARRGKAAIQPRIPDVLQVTRQYDTGHPTEKPVELLRQLISVCTIPGELIVDPFAGTGSAGIAALLENRKSYLVEVDDKWHSIGQQRIAKQISN